MAKHQWVPCEQLQDWFREDRIQERIDAGELGLVEDSPPGRPGKGYNQPRGTVSQMWAVLDEHGVTIAIAHQYRYRDGSRTELDPKVMYRELTVWDC